jgi:2-hydroxy-6-oxonona-2,4-dienedioate hydrolase
MGKLTQFATGALTGAAGVLGIKSYLQYRRDLIAAEERVKAQGKTIETQFGPIVYSVEGEGQPVLTIHGAGGGFDQALHVAQMFGEGFEWIAPCRFGYLGTPIPADASPPAQADAYAALLDTLGIERAPIIGMSAGGPSAIQFALRHPDRCTGLALVSAISKALIDVTPNPEFLEALLDQSLASDWPVWLGQKLAMHKIVAPMGVPLKIIRHLDNADEAWLHRLLEYTLPVQPRRPGLLNDFATVIRLDIFPLDEIQIPTLVIHAQDDSLVPIKQGRFSGKHIPNARLVELPSGGHLLLGQQERVRAEIEPFLRGVASGQ